MKYRKVIDAKFINRPNRFIAEVEIPERGREIVHVKNTGRCKELLIPGVDVILEESDNPNRKTKYDLIAVSKEGMGWISVFFSGVPEILHSLIVLSHFLIA